MVDFDPKYLGAYEPENYVAISYLASLIALERKIGRLLAWFDVCQSEIYTDEEVSEILKLVEWDRDQELIITKHVWNELRESLVDGVINLIAVDNNGIKREIDSRFWSTYAAPMVLSTGIIDIPMYEPTGKVYARRNDALYLGEHHREIWYRQYEDEEAFKSRTPKEWMENLTKWRAAANEDHQMLGRDEQSEMIALKTRGRPPTYDVATFWSIVDNLKEEGELNVSKRGEKKSILRKIRSMYINLKGVDELPSDDTLSDKLRSYWTGSERFERDIVRGGRLIPRVNPPGDGGK